MRYLIAIEGEKLPAGGSLPLFDQRDGLGVALRRGGAGMWIERKSQDHIIFVLEGEVAVVVADRSHTVGAEALVMIPADVEFTGHAGASALWLEFSPLGGAAQQAGGHREVAVSRADPALFEGKGFAHQKLAGRSTGSPSLRVNMLRVAPGSGSPDYHIHRFDQFYVVLEGEMELDIGLHRLRAGPMTLVHLPAGVVHRNFNAGPRAERHISLLIPEPGDGAIFDYAVEIHAREAEFFDAASAAAPTGTAPTSPRARGEIDEEEE